METIESIGLHSMELKELQTTSGGNAWWEVVFDIVDFLIDAYPPYVANGCPGTYNEGCNSLGMGLSGNTAFTGY